MKLAILGTGKIVKEVLPVFSEIKNISLISILSTERSKNIANELSKQFNILHTTTNYDDILNDSNINTVYVAVPNIFHYEYSLKALKNNKNVICEKPFTKASNELIELINISKEKKLFLLEAITNQFLKNYSYIKQNIEKLGDIKIVQCNYSQYSSRYDAFKKGENPPAFDPKMGGGALRDLNIYNIHFVVGLFDIPKGNIEYFPNIEKDIDTSGVLVIDYKKFKVICIASKDCDGGKEIKSVIQGNKGNIIINGPTNTLPEVEIKLNDGYYEKVNKNIDKHRMYEEFNEFVKIIENKDFETGNKYLEHSLKVMNVLEQAVKFMNK
jgi:predicted dehydrogenase